jgi:beta-glucosidase
MTRARLSCVLNMCVCVCVCVCVFVCVCVCACVCVLAGRTEENFGEDPTLVAAMGAAAVSGLHGGNAGGPSTYLNHSIAIVSEAKHAAAYGFGGKDGAAADLSPRTLHDVYFRPWREYMAAGGRGAMLSHNSINDVPAHANAMLMASLRNWSVGSGGILLASDM